MKKKLGLIIFGLLCFQAISLANPFCSKLDSFQLAARSIACRIVNKQMKLGNEPYNFFDTASKRIIYWKVNKQIKYYFEDFRLVFRAEDFLYNDTIVEAPIDVQLKYRAKSNRFTTLMTNCLEMQISSSFAYKSDTYVMVYIRCIDDFMYTYYVGRVLVRFNFGLLNSTECFYSKIIT
jgi:hypothetical protein